MCNRTQNDAIWGLIALFLTNQIAGNPNFLTNQIAGNLVDFKMNVINSDTSSIDRIPIIVLLREFQGVFLEFEIRLNFCKL